MEQVSNNGSELEALMAQIKVGKTPNFSAAAASESEKVEIDEKPEEVKPWDKEQPVPVDNPVARHRSEDAREVEETPVDMEGTGVVHDNPDAIAGLGVTDDEEISIVGTVTPTFRAEKGTEVEEKVEETGDQFADFMSQLMSDPAKMAAFRLMMSADSSDQASAPKGSAAVDDEPEAEVEHRNERHAPRLADDAPQEGWRAWLYKMHIPVGKSVMEIAHDKWMDSMSQIMPEGKIIACGAFKGGVGKTTEAATLASVIKAMNESAKVAAVDLDPMGTLQGRSKDTQRVDVRSLARYISEGTQKVESFASRTRDKVDIFGSRMKITDPEPTADEVNTVLTYLRAQYDFVIVDLPIYRDTDFYLEALRHLDALVYVTANTDESLDQMVQFTDMLEHNKVTNLIGRSMIVFNRPPAYTAAAADETRMLRYVKELQDNGVHVLETPFDPALHNVKDFQLSSLRKSTFWQYIQFGSQIFDILRQPIKGEE